jgi:hypothetical protein
MEFFKVRNLVLRLLAVPIAGWISACGGSLNLPDPVADQETTTQIAPAYDFQQERFNNLGITEAQKCEKYLLDAVTNDAINLVKFSLAQAELGSFENLPGYKDCVTTLDGSFNLHLSTKQIDANNLKYSFIFVNKIDGNTASLVYLMQTDYKDYQVDIYINNAFVYTVVKQPAIPDQQWQEELQADPNKGGCKPNETQVEQYCIGN